MMRPADVRHHLHLLNLSPAEAASLLGAGLRTVRRWTAPDEEGGAEPIPGAAEAALRAWLKLHRLGLSWRPDANSLVSHDVQPLILPQAHADALAAVLARVRARRGPATQWDVDLERCRATLGKMTVSFYRLRDGGFSPQSFRRADDLPIDLERDQALLEDAYACIAAKLAAQAGEPRVLLALDEPQYAFGQDHLELWDTSLSPPVLVTIDAGALRAVFDIADSDPDVLVRLARAHKRALTQRAEELLLSGHVRNIEIDMRVGPVFRRIDLSEHDLRSVDAAERTEALSSHRHRKGTV